jgi:hypothetical protein
VKTVRLIEMCLNETYNKVRVGKRYSDALRIQEGLKERCFIAVCLQLCFKNAARNVQGN